MLRIWSLSEFQKEGEGEGGEEEEGEKTDHGKKRGRQTFVGLVNIH